MSGKSSRMIYNKESRTCKRQQRTYTEILIYHYNPTWVSGHLNVQERYRATNPSSLPYLFPNTWSVCYALYSNYMAHHNQSDLDHPNDTLSLNLIPFSPSSYTCFSTISTLNNLSSLSTATITSIVDFYFSLSHYYLNEQTTAFLTINR